MPETRGLCLSEEQTVTSVCNQTFVLSSFVFLNLNEINEGINCLLGAFLVLFLFYVVQILKRPRVGGHRFVGIRTQPQKLTRKCEVTAILVLYGLPR
jgi:hypothetical protein